jgi:hypothetical protein
LEFHVKLRDGAIVKVSPDAAVGPETETEINRDKSRRVGVNASLEAGGAAPSASIGAGTMITQAEHVSFTRRTRRTIRGNGVGTQYGYWVMKEDSVARVGLDLHYDLALKLNVRPAIVCFWATLGVQPNRDGDNKRVFTTRALATSI